MADEVKRKPLLNHDLARLRQKTAQGWQLRLLLKRHVRALNHGIRTGDFTEKLDMYDRDAVVIFADPISTAYHGIDAIRAAYRHYPPHGTIHTRHLHITGQTVSADFVLDANPDRIAGQLILTFNSHLRITRKLVTFTRDHQPPPRRHSGRSR
ncbi:MAG TPA: nuclear transport factor 2 family protein [Nocardioidaceae bacterium]|nr:nuclear transport factor 2 family protein [Nocardioidaceae bacterium]